MRTDTAVPSLMFVTLVIVLIVVGGAFFWHMRKRSNRKPMEGVRERNFDEMQRGVPPEAE